MSRRGASLIAIIVLALVALAPTPAAAAGAPAWELRLASEPTNFIAGKDGRYLLLATDVGSGAAEGTIALKDTLPEDLQVTGIGIRSNDPATKGLSCAKPPATSCEAAGPVHPGRTLFLEVELAVKAALPDPSIRTDEVEISGGGAPSAKATTTTTISALAAPFGFLAGEEGFAAPAIQADGTPATQAGSHPYEMIADLGFPTAERGGVLTSSGHPRDIAVDLPPGTIGDPTATPVLCTEAELITENGPGCPPASAIGTATATTQLSGGFGLEPNTSPLYNMVPPPGAPAAFGFDAVGAGIFVHVLGSLRSETDFGLTGSVHDVIARDGNPIFAAGVELWGDPSGKEHDYSRGNCLFAGESKKCPVEPQQTAFLSLPGDCPGAPATYKAQADSWEEPEPPEEPEATYESADLSGQTAAPIDGCGGLEFQPSIEARPTTKAADSPAGLDFALKQPQQTDLGAPATASVKDVKIAFPAGLEVNAAAADGLGACDPAQIGLLTSVGTSAARFSKAPAACPDAAKIGTLEATTPLLAEYNEKHEVRRDPETGEAIPRPLHGSVYLAKPFENPFDSLIAIYLTVEDPQSGTFVKLASEVTPDPQTGRLTTTLAESPQLPVQGLKVHIFAGERGGLQTPASCGAYATTSELVPWSAPEAKAATPADSFQIDAAPGGGPCPPAPPNSPALVAGTLSPQAGTYSPLLFKLAREDGSQRIGGLEATLPPGLSAKLAGVAQCPEARIAAAIARSGPGQGALERAAPSCPAASQVGTLSAAAGAGPTPLHVKGDAYLAGPYKGAPLSFVFITPAIAGPFDLGAVVVRAAVYLDPTTAQARTVSDPLPQILHGIPLDLRSLALSVDRPGFTLNPTSCSEKDFSANVTSTLSQIAPLAERFQAGGCAALPYRPKLSASLSGPSNRGAHPSFRAVFTARAGEANTRRVVLALPRSEFIDQSHFRTVCTRVQFAASQCPAGSVYGHVKAFSPLLDYPLEGPVYLRSSSHELPDAVAALRGPPSQPLEIDLDARVDSVGGGLRFTIDTVPDAPVSKAIVTAQGAGKGLFQNSTNICKGTHRATLKLDGQNGKAHDTAPALVARCPKAKKPRRGGP